MKLNIPKPCSENWNEMTPADQGRFCQMCQKEVVDFSQKSDAEIIDFFQQPTGKVCGRVQPSQLKTYNKMKPRKDGFPLLRTAASGMVLATGLSLASAQSADQEMIRGEMQMIEIVSNPTADRETDEFKHEPSIVRGKILNVDTQAPIHFASISVKGKEHIVAFSDEKGEYVLKLTELPTEGLVLVFRYHEQVIELPMTLEEGLDVLVKTQYLKEEEIKTLMLGMMIMGDVSVEEEIPAQKEEKSSVLKRASSKLKNLFR